MFLRFNVLNGARQSRIITSLDTYNETRLIVATRACMLLRMHGAQRNLWKIAWKSLMQMSLSALVGLLMCVIVIAIVLNRYKAVDNQVSV